MSQVLRYPGRGLHGELVGRIGRDIVSGRYKPGDVVPAPPEVGAASASRTAFREAIKVLTAKSLVASKQRVGTRVRPRRDWNLLDPDVIAWQLESDTHVQCFREVTELRLLVEPAAARMAAERATAEEVEKLASAFGRMTEAVEDPDAYLAADVEFHQTLLAACHNDMIEQLGLVLGNIFRLGFSFSINVVGGSSERALVLHENVLSGLQAKDPVAAESAMRTLIMRMDDMVEHGELGVPVTWSPPDPLPPSRVGGDRDSDG
jgi:GntR family transcriptional regulator, galactonate operon transcriptional repressor